MPAQMNPALHVAWPGQGNRTQAAWKVESGKWRRRAYLAAGAGRIRWSDELGLGAGRRIPLN